MVPIFGDKSGPPRPQPHRLRAPSSRPQPHRLRALPAGKMGFGLDPISRSCGGDFRWQIWTFQTSARQTPRSQELNRAEASGAGPCGSKRRPFLAYIPTDHSRASVQSWSSMARRNLHRNFHRTAWDLIRIGPRKHLDLCPNSPPWARVPVTERGLEIPEFRRDAEFAKPRPF